MVATANILEAEIDGPYNENLAFRAISLQKIRGRFDLNRAPEPEAKRVMNRWPVPIPGQRLQVNLDTGAAAIVDPLHEPEHAATKKTAEDSGFRIAPAREEFAKVHLPTWLFYIKRAVEAGIAQVLQGEIPDDLGGEPKTHTVNRPQKDKATEGLEKMVEANTKTMNNLGRVLTEILKRLDRQPA